EVSDLPPEERVDAVLAVRPVPPTDRLAGIGSERETRAPRQSPTQSVEPDAVVSTDAAAGPGSITSRHDHRELQRSQRERRIRHQSYRVWFYGVADIRRVGCRHDLWQSGSIHSIQRTEWNDGHRRDSGHGWWNHFNFKSVDLYSSTTPIPYTITGLRNSTTTFTMAATLPNTFGNFATVVNPQAADVIDTLVIRLSNPAAICCANPMASTTS